MTDPAAGPAAACAAALAARVPRGRRLAAFSGGLDSTVLVHVLAAIAPGAFRAIHVNHGIAAESADWQAHCESVCRSLAVPFSAVHVHVGRGPNLEARARRARYRAFAALLEPGDQLLLAHHADDQLETTLLHLLQGRGTFGIPASRPLAAGEVLRPLLTVPRSALVDYARAHGLRWVEDPSNRDTVLARNFLRRDVLPALEARFPHLDRRLARVREHTAAVSELSIAALGLDREPLPVAVLEAQAPERRPLLLRLWLIALQHSSGVSDAALEAFAAALSAAADREPELVAGAVRLRRYRGAIYIVPAAPTLAECYPVPADGRLALPHGRLEVREHADGVPVAGGLEVRFRHADAPAPRIRVHGHERALGELLRAAAVPPWRRALVPLVFDDHGLAVIAGVAGRDADALPAGARRISVDWRPVQGGARGSR